MRTTLVALVLLTSCQDADEVRELRRDLKASQRRASGLERELGQCAQRRARTEATAEALPKTVTYELGARDLEPGDRITIDAVFGYRAALSAGGDYAVLGSYDLQSRARARLVLSATAFDRQASEAEGDAVVVSRGSGTFVLRLRLRGESKPHLTFYDLATGAPISGQYFGSGETLLVDKSWTYP